MAKTALEEVIEYLIERFTELCNPQTVLEHADEGGDICLPVISLTRKEVAKVTGHSVPVVAKALNYLGNLNVIHEIDVYNLYGRTRHIPHGVHLYTVGDTRRYIIEKYGLVDTTSIYNELDNLQHNQEQMLSRIANLENVGEAKAGGTA